jgi:kumamolisin
MKWVRSRRAAAAVLAAGSAGTLLAMGLAGPAGAANSPKIAIPQGAGAHQLSTLPVFGNTPPSTAETVSFILNMRNERSLEAQVNAGMPGGYMSVGQFAREYGQPQSNISALENYLAGYGISSTAYRDGLDVTANGTAGEFDSALSVQQQQFRVPAVRATPGRLGHAAMMIHGTLDTPLLPRNLGDFVLSVLGLDDYPTYASDAVKAIGPKEVNYSATEPYNLTPSFFTKNYNLDPLLRAGATGAGETIGIVTLAALNPTDAEYFWSNVLGISTKANRITIDNVDGGPGAPSLAAGSDETQLDVEQSGAIAPNANIVVYQAPNTDFGYVDAFMSAASQNVAGSVSASWGQSETNLQAAINIGVEDPNYAASFSEAFLEMAAQGQSTFVSSGDQGAYDAAYDLGTTNLAVDQPGDSPWVTSSGGTTIGGTQTYAATSTEPELSITIPSERAWGWDYLWPYWSEFGGTSETEFIAGAIGGTGGGFSVDDPTPAYQQGINGTHHYSAVQYLTPTDYVSEYGLTEPTGFSFNPTPSVTTGYATGRAEPDLAANADPQTGYEVYFTGFEPTFSSDIEQYGGTSFIGPQMNGSTAVIDSYLGHRVGFWNPAIYQFAQLRNSPFTPLDATGTNNDNLYFSGTRGAIYNPGTGLGTPNLAELAFDFGRYGG